MGPRITAAEQAEALTFLERQNEVARQMAQARGDVALEQLEASMNGGLIDMTRIETMTPDNLRQLRVIDQNLTAMLADPAVVQQYLFDEAKANTLFMAEFYNEPLRSIFREIGQNYTPALHAQMQQEWQAEAAAQEVVAEAREAAGFTPRQSDFLTAPNLQLATLIADVQAEGGTEEEKMASLRRKMNRKVLSAYNDWLRDSRELMQSVGGDELQTFESGLAETNLGVRNTSTQWVGRTADRVGDAAGNVFGNLSQFSFTPLSEHAFLSTVFSTRESLQAAYAGLSASSGEAESLIAGLVQNLTSNLTFEHLSSQFVLIPDNPSEMTDEQLRALESKMETVPKFFRNKDFASQYYDFLRTSIGTTVEGDISKAPDFKEWFATLEMHPLMKMFYQFIMMIPDEIMDYFDGAEDDKTEAEINGADLQALRDEIARRIDNPEDPVTAPVATTSVERETYLDDLAEYTTVRDTYRELTGDAAARPEIMLNGEPLGTTPLTPEAKTFLTNIAAMIRLEPSSVPLLSRNLELSDLHFLSEHTNDVNSDGVNVEYSPTGMRIYADLHYFLPEGFTSWFDREWLVGSTLAGSAGAIAYFSGVFWPAVLGGLAVGGLAYTIGEGMELTMSESSYEKLDAGTLARMVAQVSTSMEALQTATTQRVNQLRDIPVAERTEILESSGFIELQENLPEFWGSYQLTSLDVLLFNEFENGSGDFSFDESRWFNIFHADNIEAGDEYINETGAVVTATSDIRGFQVEGTGSWFGAFTRDNFYDYRFKNVESFFAWLRTSPKAAEFEAQLAANSTT